MSERNVVTMTPIGLMLFLESWWLHFCIDLVGAKYSMW